MIKLDNCSKCIHKDVCIQRPVYETCSNNVKSIGVPLSSINLVLTCKHFKAKPKKRKKAVKHNGEEPVQLLP